MAERLAVRVVKKIARSAGVIPPAAPAAPPSEAQNLVVLADAARDEGRLSVAAVYYAQALKVEPGLGPIHVQAGHMFKEIGDLETAERHYLEALRLMPQDADLALQLGHFYKLSARPTEARRSYVRALQVSPGWSAAEVELEALHAMGWRGQRPPENPEDSPALQLADLETDRRPDELRIAPLYGRMAPELLPREPDELFHYSEDSIVIRQFGVEQRTYWGYKPVARGIEAIRGFIISEAPILGLDASVNDLLIHRGPVKGPYDLEYEPDKRRIKKYVFNIWIDFSDFTEGHYRLDLTVKVAGEADRTSTQWFVVEPALLESDHPNSDGVINLPPGVEGSLEEQIQARPSVVREAWRPNQLGDIRSILVARSDQLGDLIASIPAVTRLREIFPEAKLVGVLGPANVGLARTLGVFNEIIVLDHAESWRQRTRPLSLAQQIEFRDMCAPHRFDLAIDLSQSLMSRPMLQLSGARLLYGFKDPTWQRLTSSYEDHLLDPKNRRESAAHSKRVLSLIERLHTATHPTAKVIRRTDLSRDVLSSYGLKENDRYAVLHAGARIVWSRWAHLPALAQRLLEDTDLKVVFFAADDQQKGALSDELKLSDRFIFLERQLPFDDFDALLSFCTVYVGNDSGPKHLASLRGAPVVSIHSSRINWSEWGQEQTGVIISRKVPCAGCTLYHDADECGKDYACMEISVQQVYDAVRRYV